MTDLFPDVIVEENCAVGSSYKGQIIFSSHILTIQADCVLIRPRILDIADQHNVTNWDCSVPLRFFVAHFKQ